MYGQGDNIRRKIKRRDNLLYALRRKGGCVKTKEKTIYKVITDVGTNYQIECLKREYNFKIQIILC